MYSFHYLCLLSHAVTTSFSNQGGAYLFYQLVACLGRLISFLLAMVAEGQIPPTLSTFLESGGFPFEVLDVVS